MTFSPQPVDNSSSFFSKLGTNARTCATCHDSSDGWSITPPHLQQRFQDTQGTDPIFLAVDGANCPSDDVSNPAASAAAYSLLLKYGVIRITLPVPANAEFSIIAINDPNQCPETTASLPALYRRPLPSTNLRFLGAIMWDGREPDLPTQAKDAVLAHTQPSGPPTDAQLQQIVSLESSLFTAQSADTLGGDLTSQGVNGGPVFLSTQPFTPGMNSGSAFNPDVFTLYANWANASGGNAAAQQSIARGEALFNTLAIVITGVPGFNDVQGQPQIVGSCSSCHNAPNVGGNSSPAMMNLGTTSLNPDLPSYVLLCNDGTQVTTSDPGRALVTGKCADIDKFKVPGMRGLAARPPYFHDGSAATLTDVLNFYMQRFNLPLTSQQKADLIAFMNTL